MSSENNPVIMSGKKLAEKMHATLREEVAELKAQNVTPGLGTLLVGGDPASGTYIAMKHKATRINQNIWG